MFAGCQIPYPKREFLTEEEPEDKADKVRNVRHTVSLEMYSMPISRIYTKKLKGNIAKR